MANKRETNKVMMPALKCPSPTCGHQWIPRKGMGPRRCPKCFTITVPR